MIEETSSTACQKNCPFHCETLIGKFEIAQSKGLIVRILFANCLVWGISLGIQPKKIVFFLTQTNIALILLINLVPGQEQVLLCLSLHVCSLILCSCSYHKKLIQRLTILSPLCNSV